jgi:protein-disulfide isomerase
MLKKKTLLPIFSLIISLNLPLLAQAEQVAVLNGEPIMRNEVENRSSTKLYRLRWEIYDTLKTDAQSLVDERLLEEEAKRRGLSVDEMLQQEVDARANVPTEADVDQYIEEHELKEAGEDVRARILTYLTDRERIQRKLDFQEELRGKAHYEFLLEPPERPRQQVSVDDDPMRGNPNAPITIIHFASFSCEHCAASSRKIQKLTEDFPGLIRWVHRDFFNIFDEVGLMAAEAGETAHAQGKFWEFHDHIYSLNGEFTKEDIPRLLAEVGVDTSQFEKIHKEAAFIMEIKKDIEDGVAAGVTGVPAIFINGRYISGTFPYEKLKAMVEEEVQLARPKAQQALSEDGVAPESAPEDGQETQAADSPPQKTAHSWWPFRLRR